MMTGWRVRAAYGAIVGLSMAALVACAQGDEESRGPLGEGRGVVTDDDANRPVAATSMAAAERVALVIHELAQISARNEPSR